MSAQTTSTAVTHADIGIAEVWGGATNVVGIKHLFFSDQPDTATFIEARDRGIGVVISLLEPAEFDWDEASAATNAGLTNWASKGKWVHVAKIVFEKYFLRKVRQSRNESFWEKQIMEWISAEKLKGKG